ncbi:copper amine oxidase N-terminal domain-containing protein [Paenibacillus woosongensis]|uniref:Copper amine oxidase N-terminal domain-containing protein n=1 Tax=Paenibacillus woosongensis TaxID=307580 RepID=A0AA95L2H9_9BACL|nr:copper amine oxidase N-terminal domain-containing protein [Paenibacillus woosongensis]WHX49722.1 copper amine oxidase N-terminal domain-containing protein [Paenibacillus woosongensis]
MYTVVKKSTQVLMKSHEMVKPSRSKLMLSFLVFILGVIGASNSFAAENTEDLNTPVEIVVNGEFISIDASPVFDNSYLLVPIRALSSLGLSYEWHPSTGKVRIYDHLQGVFLEITQDSRTAHRDGKTLEMTIPAQNRNGRIMVPLRFISEAFDYKVQYETIRKMVFISSPGYEFDQSLIVQENLQAARKAAIALPIKSDFKVLGFPTRPNHAYVFIAGRADMYKFDDQYTTSFVEIKDGEAKLIAQYVSGPRSTFLHKAGNIKIFGEPLMQQYYGPPFSNPVSFVALGDGTSITGYYEGDEPHDFITPITFYSDIIQEVPGNK